MYRFYREKRMFPDISFEMVRWSSRDMGERIHIGEKNFEKLNFFQKSQSSDISLVYKYFLEFLSNPFHRDICKFAYSFFDDGIILF
jgi:hypothetical protein